MAAIKSGHPYELLFIEEEPASYRVGVGFTFEGRKCFYQSEPFTGATQTQIFVEAVNRLSQLGVSIEKVVDFLEGKRPNWPQKI